MLKSYSFLCRSIIHRIHTQEHTHTHTHPSIPCAAQVGTRQEPIQLGEKSFSVTPQQYELFKKRVDHKLQVSRGGRERSHYTFCAAFPFRIGPLNGSLVEGLEGSQEGAHVAAPRLWACCLLHAPSPTLTHIHTLVHHVSLHTLGKCCPLHAPSPLPKSTHLCTTCSLHT